jgi:hypothetical protein
MLPLFYIVTIGSSNECQRAAEHWRFGKGDLSGPVKLSFQVTGRSCYDPYVRDLVRLMPSHHPWFPGHPPRGNVV